MQTLARQTEKAKDSCSMVLAVLEDMQGFLKQSRGGEAGDEAVSGGAGLGRIF
jgi:hypothetical protein